MFERGATRSLRSGYGLALLEFRILGPLEVVGEDGPLRLGGPKQRAVLAILLLNANRVVSVDSLAEDLYGDAPPASALTQIQAQISQLRKLVDPGRARGAARSLIETRPPGYVIRLASEQLDLRVFERRTREAAEALAGNDSERASHLYRDALDLWRGTPLADLAHESFAQPAVARLEDLRMAALEGRIDAELSLGRHAELAAELEALVSEQPLRERLHGQLMLALYRSGRQAEALEAYRRLRRTLVDELGIEPSPALQELERAILRQESSLDVAAAARVEGEAVGSILVVAPSQAALDSLASFAEPLAERTSRELVVVRPVAEEEELERAAAAVNACRRRLSVSARAAAFVSSGPSDVLRLISSSDVELVLMDGDGLAADVLPVELADVFEHSPAQVAVVAGAFQGDVSRVLVPFGGGVHDWAALELGAWLATAAGHPLTLAGTRGRPQEGRRDASRLLADASLAVQRLVDVEAEPLLLEPTEQALVAAAQDSVVVVGVSPRWRTEGVGATRRALLRVQAPVVLVHRGLRPGGLAPRESRTRFTWTLQV